MARYRRVHQIFERYSHCSARAHTHTHIRSPPQLLPAVPHPSSHPHRYVRIATSRPTVYIQQGRYDTAPFPAGPVRHPHHHQQATVERRGFPRPLVARLEDPPSPVRRQTGRSGPTSPCWPTDRSPARLPPSARTGRVRALPDLTCRAPAVTARPPPLDLTAPSPTPSGPRTRRTSNAYAATARC